VLTAFWLSDDAGRNYESFGEDPFLSSELARASVRGIQSQGVIGCVKHWVANDQENDRFTVDTHVSERALWELHYAPFQAAIDVRHHHLKLVSQASAFRKFCTAYWCGV
jgi:beta-glucosidase-like glycosyl hydrolase